MLTCDVIPAASVQEALSRLEHLDLSPFCPHLLVYIDGKPVTYWPQVRKKKTATSIDTFLENALNSEVVGLEKIAEVKRCLKAR